MRETIELVHTKPTETQELPCRIPTDSPRYHFFIFKHSYQGQQQEALGQYSASLQDLSKGPFKRTSPYSYIYVYDFKIKSPILSNIQAPLAPIKN